MSSIFVALWRYWQFIYHIISVQNQAPSIILKSLKIQISVLTSSTILFRRIYLNYLILFLTVVSTLYFQLYEISCTSTPSHWLSWKNRWADILILVDSWWLLWLWKQLFSKIKKKHINFEIWFLFLSVCYLVSLITGQIWHYCCQKKVPKTVGITKFYVLKNLLCLYWLRHRFFSHKKIYFSYFFVIIDVRFIDVRHILDICKSDGILLEELTNLFNYFIL